MLHSIKKEQEEAIHIQILRLKGDLQRAITQEQMVRKIQIAHLIENKHLHLIKIKQAMLALDKNDQQRKIEQLKELNNAYALAKSANIINMFDGAMRLNNHNKDNKDNKSVIDINLSKNPDELYLKGTIYLQKAIELVTNRPHAIGYELAMTNLQNELYAVQHDPKLNILEKRQNDLDYVAKIESKLIELQRLKHLVFNIKDVQLFNIYGLDVGTSAIKSNKLLILVAGSLLGFMLAAFVVLIRNSVKSRAVT